MLTSNLLGSLVAFLKRETPWNTVTKIIHFNNQAKLPERRRQPDNR